MKISLPTEPPPWEPCWTHARAACWLCGYRWVAVYPVGTPALQCPGCRMMTALFEGDEGE